MLANFLTNGETKKKKLEKARNAEEKNQTSIM